MSVRTATRYTKEDVLAHLQDSFYRYRVTHREEPPSYSNGGLPEEGILVCKDCAAVIGDDHYEACEVAELYDRLVDIMEGLA